MIQKLLILGAGLFTAVALNSCGGVPADPLNDQSANQVLTLLLSGGNAVFSGLPQSNTAPTLPFGGATTSGGPATSVAGCETVTTSGDTPDGDGIDSLKTYTYDCTDFTDGTTQYTRKGTVVIEDLDNNVAGVMGGLRVEFDAPVFKSVDLTSNTEYRNKYVGFWQYKKVGGTLTSTSEFNGGLYYETTYGVNDYEYTYTWDWNLTPDDDAQAWTTGSIEVSGTFRLAGRFVNEVNGVHAETTGEFFVNYRTENLRYDDSCPTNWYKSGSLFIEDGNGMIIEVRYENCDVTLFVNGKESDLWAP